MNKTIVRFGLMASLVAAVVAASVSAADGKYPRGATLAFMRMKLAWSREVLEGLTLEKFDKVSLNAIRMRDMTQSNQWLVIRQTEYLARTTNYQKHVDALYMAAVDKDLPAATEAYVNVTRSCIECHRLVRIDQRKNAGQPTKPPQVPNTSPIIR